MLLKKLFHKHLATPFLLWNDPRAMQLHTLLGVQASNAFSNT